MRISTEKTTLMRPLLLILFCVFISMNCFCQDSLAAGDLQHPSEQLRQQDALPITSGLNRNNIFLLVLFGGMMLMASGIAFIAYRNRQKAKEVQLLASKDREIAMQREQLYVNITHELRTPLTLIISPLERLASKNPHPDVSMALHHAQELLHRFNDILKWNKLEANAMTLSPQVGEVVEEVQKIVDRMRPIAESKGLNMECLPGFEECWCQLDFEKLDTILSNLLMNAIKFTDRGGAVKVEIDLEQSQSPGHIQLKVSDNGKGISEEALSGIFDRFRQVGSGASMGGAGIGLALVKRLTDLMKGDIKVESVPVSGTMFTLNFPLKMVDKLPEKQVKTGPTIVNNVKGDVSKDEKAQLLLVEDSPDLRNFIASTLQPVYDLLQVASVPDALELARENLPDIIISDIMLLGERTGIDLCRELKSDPLTSHIPVLMLTARSGSETKQKALEAGVDAYLTKPFSVRELELSLDNLLENRRILRERFQTTLKLDWTEAEPATPATDPYIEMVLKQIHKHLDDSQFGIEQLAQSMKISRVQLFKKIKSLTGMPPADLLRTIRLETAMRLLETGAGNVSEVAYQTGFDNPNYFSKAFKQHFGKGPSEIRELNSK